MASDISETVISQAIFKIRNPKLAYNCIGNTKSKYTDFSTKISDDDAILVEITSLQIVMYEPL